MAELSSSFTPLPSSSLSSSPSTSSTSKIVMNYVRDRILRREKQSLDPHLHHRNHQTHPHWPQSMFDCDDSKVNTNLRSNNFHRLIDFNSSQDRRLRKRSSSQSPLQSSQSNKQDYRFRKDFVSKLSQNSQPFQYLHHHPHHHHSRYLNHRFQYHQTNTKSNQTSSSLPRFSSTSSSMLIYDKIDSLTTIKTTPSKSFKSQSIRSSSQSSLWDMIRSQPNHHLQSPHINTNNSIRNDEGDFDHNLNDNDVVDDDHQLLIDNRNDFDKNNNNHDDNIFDNIHNKIGINQSDSVQKDDDDDGNGNGNKHYRFQHLPQYQRQQDSSIIDVDLQHHHHQHQHQHQHHHHHHHHQQQQHHYHLLEHLYNEREREYYKDYDPMVGIRIGFSLGLLILMFILFVLYKTHCQTKKNRRYLESFYQHQHQQQQQQQHQQNKENDVNDVNDDNDDDFDEIENYHQSKYRQKERVRMKRKNFETIRTNGHHNHNHNHNHHHHHHKDRHKHQNRSYRDYSKRIRESDSKRKKELNAIDGNEIPMDELRNDSNQS
ncbi:hypothetical protein SSS_01876 [Sarcoptes scabiei]|uniref:Uncharacterized protein n=1 Tax=Sarcoptes scabiei TaxID=52283 RepID=A0A834RC77_SARSC|nr:hypothetical protein SSS_01876 [Sarcoptes scabiei]